jgi:hypothetical protein
VTDELRAAAERVRRAKAGEHPFAIYGEDDAQTQGWHDRKVLAEAWLAANPADDGEPVTEDWLRDQGWDSDGYDLPYWTLPAARRRGITIGVFTGKSRMSRLVFGREPVAQPATRGDVRRLLAAIGVPS